MKYLYLIIPVFLCLISVGCNSYPPIQSDDLDSKSYVDSAINFPENYLISAHNTKIDKSKPVLIAAHGYTATPFEWLELKNYLRNQDSTVYISRVLLGGHGRDYDAFNSTTWKDWQKPILDEYAKLYEKGFRNISLAGSSTGCPLILDLISSHTLDTLIHPRNVFFIDPIIVPSNKMLNYVNVLGMFIPYVTVDVSHDEKRYWYQYRGKKSLVQLNKVIKHSRKELKKGISLSPETKNFLVYKVKEDGSADPESAQWLYDGIKKSDGSTIDTFMLNSDLHVFTRLSGRTSFSEKDIELQQDAFKTIYQTIIEN